MGDAAQVKDGIEIFQGIKTSVIAERAFCAEFVEIDVAFENDFCSAGTSRSTVSHFTNSTGFAAEIRL